MSRAFRILLLAAVLAAAAATPASAGHRGHGPSGIAGTVLQTTCAGSCPQPLAAQPFTGSGLTVSVRRVSDGGLVATVTPAEGAFRVRTRRGWFDVTATLAPTNPCGPVPMSRIICPVAMAPVCGPSSDSARVRVRRHRFTRVVLHVQDGCSPTPQ